MIVFSFAVVIGAVENSFVGSIEESVWSGDIPDVDETTVGVEFADNWVVVAMMVLSDVSSVDITNGEDTEEDSVELERISFVVDKILDEVAVDLGAVEKVCV